MLDFTPNAVHSGHLRGAAPRATTRRRDRPRRSASPGDSTDAPKLLAAGRARLRDPRHPRPRHRPRARPRRRRRDGDRPAPAGRGHRPRRRPVRRPRDLEGRTVGVTGLPSDEAVVDSEIARRRRRPRRSTGSRSASTPSPRWPPARSTPRPGSGMPRPSRSAPGRPDPRLQSHRYGAPPYPELILTASRQTDRPGPDSSTRWSKRPRAATDFAVRPPGARPSTTCSPRSQPRPRQTRRPSSGSCARPSPRPVRPEPCWANGRAWDLEHGLLERPARRRRRVPASAVEQRSTSSGSSRPSASAARPPVDPGRLAPRSRVSTSTCE